MGDTGFTFRFDAIGTTWTVESKQLVPTQKQQNLLAQIMKRIAAFDKNYSRFREDSLVRRMANAAGDYQLPNDARPLFDIHHKLYTMTNGMFTMLIGDTLEDAGYDPAYSLTPKQVIRTAKRWEDALIYSFPELTIIEPVVIDLGSGGKGYLADLVADVLIAERINDFCINAGGDIVQHSATNLPTTIALEDPDDNTRTVGTATLVNNSISGSSSSRRYWDNYHHIINPSTRTSPKNIRAVWVIAKTGLLSDSLSTALYFVEPEVLLKQFDFNYAIIYEDHSIAYSKNFTGEFFS